MPRQARIDAPGAVHHIIARGIEQGRIFRDDQDCENFLKRLGQIIIETQTKCFSWALIPNHFHLLLKTGNEPISTVMRRLLTGYAVSYNRRHERCGHVFQNRYKSILCQEDVYLKELVRYIHLNPLRAGLVYDIGELDHYQFAGHSYLMAKRRNDWQSIEDVLAFFGRKKNAARQSYREYLIKGIEKGRQPELVGGGLIRSAGGWTSVQSLRRTGAFQKSDERILGDGDFVESVLANARERMQTRYEPVARGVTLEHVISAVSRFLGIDPEEIVGPSKVRVITKARALVCHWAVRGLGMSMTDVAGSLKISVPTVSVAVKRGIRLAQKEGLVLQEILKNIKM